MLAYSLVLPSWQAKGVMGGKPVRAMPEVSNNPASGELHIILENELEGLREDGA